MDENRIKNYMGRVIFLYLIVIVLLTYITVYCLPKSYTKNVIFLQVSSKVAFTFWIGM